MVLENSTCNEENNETTKVIDNFVTNFDSVSIDIGSLIWESTEDVTSTSD